MEFARKTGFGQPYISQILSGAKKNPRPGFFAIVCREFNVNPEWLKSGKGEVYSMPGMVGENEDAEILAKYRLLPLSERRLIEDMINALLVKSMNGENDKKPPKAKKVVQR